MKSKKGKGRVSEREREKPNCGARTNEIWDEREMTSFSVSLNQLKKNFTGNFYCGEN